MLKFPCLVLDHDDTVVQTEKTLGYPYFCEVLQKFRPGQTISLADYVSDCHKLGFAEMCRRRWQFTPEEQKQEYAGWMDYLNTHIPDVFPGIKDVILRQKAEGGLICVVSHSSIQNITRDYAFYFGIQPDAVYGWDLPKENRKPSPYPLLHIMEAYRLKPSELLVADDAMLGWQMANAVNVPIAFAGWSKQDYPELCREMERLCNHSFDSPAALFDYLYK